VLLVVGANNSSNSNRLREVGEKSSINSYLIQSVDELQTKWFMPDSRIGVTAGASTPEILIVEVLNRLKKWGVSQLVEMEAEPEAVTFPLPAILRKSMSA